MVPAIHCIGGLLGWAVEYDLDMDTNSARTQSHQSICIASIWFGFALVDAMDMVLVMRGEGMHPAWAKLFVTTMLSWLPWALSTAFVLRLGPRFPPVRLRPGVTWGAHLR